MKTFLIAGAAALTFAGAAFAQTATVTTTTRTVAPPAVVVAPPRVVRHDTVYGDTVKSRTTTYRAVPAPAETTRTTTTTERY